jgi:hypothetical protein
MFGIEQSTLVGVSLIVAGFLLGNIQWIYLHKWLQNRAIRRVRRELSNNMPITIEQLEAERRLNQARTQLELQHLLTRIAEIELRESESEAKVIESLNIIDRLHHQIELLNLEITARKKREELTLYSSLDQPKEETETQ